MDGVSAKKQVFPGRLFFAVGAALVHVVLVINIVCPVIRHSSPKVNLLFVALALPLLLVATSISVRVKGKLRPHWKQFVFGFGTIDAAVLLGVFYHSLAFRDGNDQRHLPIAVLDLGPSRVIAYETGGGVLSSLGLEIRHERRIIGELLIVRNLDHFAEAREIYLARQAENIIQVTLRETPYGEYERRVENRYRLKSWVYP